MNIFPGQLLRAFIAANAFSLAAAVTCVAGSYKWTDRDGTLHFSDTLPAEDVPLADLDPADPEQRPLLGKPLVVYQDKVFIVTLTKESDDLLQFDLTYTDIHRAFPEIVSSMPRLQINAVTGERIYTYLAYSVFQVEGGSKTLQFINRMSKLSPSSLETESLRISLYDYSPDRNKSRELFSTNIPFVKQWQKQKGVLYQ